MRLNTQMRSERKAALACLRQQHSAWCNGVSIKYLPVQLIHNLLLR